jgi:hypothetical protein
MKLDPFSWLSIYVFVRYVLALDGFHIILEDTASGFVCLFVPRSRVVIGGGSSHGPHARYVSGS